MLPVDAINTLRVVEAGITEAFVDLGRAQLIIVAIRTQALKRVDIIEASSTVQTWVRFTLVDVQLTETTYSEHQKKHIIIYKNNKNVS